MKKHIDSRAKTVTETTVAYQIITLMNNNGFLVWRVPNSGTVNTEVLFQSIMEIIGYVHAGTLPFRPMPKQTKKPGESRAETLCEKAVRAAIAKSWRKAAGVLPGVWDIVGIDKRTGKMVIVEIKFGNDKLSDDQRVFEAIVLKAGGQSFTVKDFPTFSDYFRNTVLKGKTAMPAPAIVAGG